MCPQDREDCYIGSEHVTKAFEMVDSTWLDAEFVRHSWKHVYILSIDTEGFDYSVIHGAMSMLSKQAVTFLYFEYHAINQWKKETLQVRKGVCLFVVFFL